MRNCLKRLPIYLTVDIDVLDPAVAPGTGCPEPGGLQFPALIKLISQLGNHTIVGMDVVEVFPVFDPAGITATAAAKVIRETILTHGKRNKVE
jgi:agmatinase